MDRKNDGVQEAASQLAKLLHDTELKQSDAIWLEAATALVAHARAQDGGCLSRRWQLAAGAARTIPALISIMSHHAAPPALKLETVEALRLVVCTNDINQAAASSAAEALVCLVTMISPPSPHFRWPQGCSVGQECWRAAARCSA